MIVKDWGYFKLPAPAYRQAGKGRDFPERYAHLYCAPLPRLPAYRRQVSGVKGHAPVNINYHKPISIVNQRENVPKITISPNAIWLELIKEQVVKFVQRCEKVCLKTYHV